MCSAHGFIAGSIIEKWKRAVIGLRNSKTAFEELSDRLKPEWMREWRQQEKCAVEERGENLRIYDVTLPNGRCFTPSS